MTLSLTHTLRQIAAEAFELTDASQLADGARMEDVPEWDSFAHIRLLTSVQSYFDVSIGPGDIDRTLSLTDLESLLSETTGGPAPARKKRQRTVFFDKVFAQLWRDDPLREDDIIYIHSRSEALLKASTDALAICLEALSGAERTLIFPAFPFSGRTYASYLNERPLFKVGATPALTGLFPELVRQQKGTIRSAHPLLSECAIGPRAAWLMADSHRDPMPFHAASTYARMVEGDAAMVGLGVDIATNALIHMVDYKVREQLGFPIFCEDPVNFTIEHADGRREECSFLAYAPEMTKQIKPRAVRSFLSNRPECLFEIEADGIPFYRLRLRPFLELCQAEAERALATGKSPPWHQSP